MPRRTTPARRPCTGLILAGALAWSGSAVARSPAQPSEGVAPAAPAGAAVPWPPAPARATAEVFFSPAARADIAIIDTLDAARERIWLAGYQFTLPSIAQALARAQARGVDVRVVLDRSQALPGASGASDLHARGVPLRIDVRHPAMHHKFVVVDGDTVGVGSMNFTRAGARHNAENFNLFRHWTALADTYAREFDRLLRDSEPYAPGRTFERRETGAAIAVPP